MAKPPTAYQRLALTRLAARRGGLVLAAAVAIRLALVGWCIGHLPWVTADIAVYAHMVQQSDAGFYPFRHFWMEYPPVFPLLAVGLYRALVLLPRAGAAAFMPVYAVLMSGVDIGNLLLVHRLARRAHGPAAAGVAALIYAACPVPVWFGLGWFDALAVLALLAGLLLMVERRAAPAGVVAALGALTKLFPIVLVVVAPLSLGWLGTRRFVAALAATFVVCVAPLLTRADLLVASFASFLTRPPWETLPALALRSYSFPILVPIEDRFTAATAFAPVSRWSGLALLPQAALLLALWGAWRLWRARRGEPSDACVLAALAVATLLLGSRGFSPQFVVWLLPLIVIVWPSWIGLWYVVLFSAHVLAYYVVVAPAMAGYYAWHTVPIEQVAAVSWASVTARTQLLCVIVGHLLVVVHRRATRPMAAGERHERGHWSPFGAKAASSGPERGPATAVPRWVGQLAGRRSGHRAADPRPS